MTLSWVSLVNYSKRTLEKCTIMHTIFFYYIKYSIHQHLQKQKMQQVITKWCDWIHFEEDWHLPTLSNSHRHFSKTIFFDDWQSSFTRVSGYILRRQRKFPYKLHKMNAIHCILHRSHHLHFLKCSTATLLYFSYLLQVMVNIEIWPFQG